VFTDSHQIKKKNKHVSHANHIFQTKLSDFIDGTLLYLKRKIRIPYKTKPVQVNYEKYIDGALPESQILAFQKYSTFHGYLNNIFAFMNRQMNHGYKPQQNFDFLNFNNIFKLEITRCKLGYTHFNSWIMEFNQNTSLRKELGILSQYHLTVRSYLRNLNIISSCLNEYTNQLKQECRALNLIGDKIWIWDRRFFECNSNGVKCKETGKLS
jgi:predicted patatin/cPLA2 family phospholipase